MLCGCAAVVVPTQVRFPSLKPGPDQVQMFDACSSQAREYREEGPGHAFKFLADGAMQPRPADLVASRIAAALPESARGRAIELRRLDIGSIVSPRWLLPGSSDVSLSVPSGTPAGAIAAGLVLAYGMIAAFNGARADASGVAHIEVGVRDDLLRTAQSVSVARNIGAVQAVETALASALDELADQARWLSTRGQGTP
jgi:hypothetical protein